MRIHDDYTNDKYSFEDAARIAIETGLRAIVIMTEEKPKPGHYKAESMIELQDNLFVLEGVKKVNAE